MERATAQKFRKVMHPFVIIPNPPNVFPLNSYFTAQLKRAPQFFGDAVEFDVGSETYGLGGANHDLVGFAGWNPQPFSNLEDNGPLRIHQCTIRKGNIGKTGQDEILFVFIPLLFDDFNHRGQVFLNLLAVSNDFLLGFIGKRQVSDWMG